MDGKTSSSNFTRYYSNYTWGWADGVTCVKNNTSYDVNGCIIWEQSSGGGELVGR